MNSDFIIKIATQEDINDIMEIEQSSFNEEAFTKSQMLYLVTQSQGVFYGVYRDTKMVAYISLATRINSSLVRVYSVAVHPNFRGNKLGQMLLDKAVEYALEHKLTAITLEVDTTNSAAIGLYEKNGFRRLSVKEGYYHNGDAFAMRKDIV